MFHRRLSPRCVFVYAIWFLAAGRLWAQPDNDLFSGRILIAGTNVTVEGTLLDATGEAEESLDGKVSVWWELRASRDTYVRLTIAKWTNSFEALPQLVGFADTEFENNVSMWRRKSEGTPQVYTFRAETGRAYYVKAVGERGSKSRFTLQMEELPGAISAPDVSGEFVEVEGNTEGAEPPFSALYPTGWELEPKLRLPSAAWRWYAPGTGKATLEVIEGTAKDLEATLTVSTNSYAVNSEFDVTAGQYYLLSFHSRTGQEGTFGWKLTFTNVPPVPVYGTRLVWEHPGIVLPRHVPFTIAITNLPATPLQGIRFFVDSTIVQTNAPSEHLFTWIPTKGLHTFAAQVIDMEGTIWPVQGFWQQFGVANDLFAHAWVFQKSDPLTTVSLGTATREPDEPGSGNRSVWYSWTSREETDARVTLTANNAVTNMLVGVYRGTSLATLEPVATETLFVGGSGRFTFRPEPDVRYYVRVASGDVFPTNLRISFAAGKIPANDNIANAERLEGTNITVTSDLLMATLETGEPAFSPYTKSHSVWFTWSNRVDGELELILPRAPGLVPFAGPFFQTTNGLRQVPTAFSFSVSEQASALVRGGSNYFIMLDAYSTAQTSIWGEVTMQARFQQGPGNDRFEDRVALVGDNVEIRGTLKAARGEEVGPIRTSRMDIAQPTGRRAVWYQWTAERDARTVVTVHSDTIRVAAYQGNALTNLVALSTGGTSVAFQAEAGVTYIISFASPEDAPGKDFIGFINSTAAVNDAFAERAILSGTPTNWIANHSLSSVEPGEPVNGTNSLWWTWIAPHDGWASLIAPTDIWMDVYTGSELSSLEAVPVTTFEGTRQGGILQNWSGFETEQGITYQIALSSTNSPKAREISFDLTTLRFRGERVEARLPIGDALNLEIDDYNSTVDGELLELAILRKARNGVATIVHTNLPAQFSFTSDQVGKELLYWAATNVDGQERKSRPLLVRVVPVNDDFARARAVEGAAPELLTFDECSTEVNEPVPERNGTSGTRWWKWTAPATGDARFTVRYGFGSSGEEFGAGVYTGSSLETLARVPLAFDPVERGQSVIFLTDRGRTYYIQLAGRDDMNLFFEEFTWSPIRVLGNLGTLVTSDFIEIPVAVDWPPEQIKRLKWISVPGGAAIGVSYEPPFTAYFPYHGESIRAEVELKDGKRLPSTVFLSAPWRVSNDSYGGRWFIEPEATIVNVSSGPYTREPGEPSHGVDESFGTVWFTWRAPADGVLQVIAGGTEDAVALYKGSLLNFVNSGPAVDTQVTRGSTYDIAVCTKNSYAGFVLRYKNETEPAVQTLVGTSGEFFVDFGTPVNPNNGTAHDEFNWTAPADGIVVFSLKDQASWYVPRLAGPAGEVVRHAAGPNAGFEVSEGASYRVIYEAGLHALQKPKWAYLLHTPKTNDLFVNAFELPTETDATPCFERGGSWQEGEPRIGFWDTATVWFKWTATRSGAVSAHAGVSRVFIYSGTNQQSLKIEGSEFAFQAVAGKTYYVAVAQPFMPPPFGSLPLRMDFLTLRYTTRSVPNDDLVGAALIRGWSTNFVANTRGVTREMGEPMHGGVYSGRTVWWKWQAPTEGRVRIVSMPRYPAGARKHQVAVYRGDSMESLAPVSTRAFDETGGDLVFNVVSNLEYKIVFAGEFDAELDSDIYFEFLPDVVVVPNFEEIRIDGGKVNILFTGGAGATYTLESSRDLVNWAEEGKGTIAESGMISAEPLREDAARKFFRVKYP